MVGTAGWGKLLDLDDETWQLDLDAATSPSTSTSDVPPPGR